MTNFSLSYYTLRYDDDDDQNALFGPNDVNIKQQKVVSDSFFLFSLTGVDVIKLFLEEIWKI